MRSVQSRTELTDAAADMLIQTESALTVSVPPALYEAAADCVPAAGERSVLCETMLDTLTWERRGRFLTVTAVYTDAPDAVRAKKRRLSEYASEWAKTTADHPPAVRVLLAHELLCNSCTYSETAPDCGSAYGALIGSAARCAGYAEGFALLLEAALGTNASIWIGLQADYNMQKAKQDMSFMKRLEKIRKIAAVF